MTEYNPLTNKSDFNFRLSNFSKTNPTTTVEDESKSAQSKRISVQGSLAQDIGENLGGFLTLSKNTKQNQTVTDEPIVSIITDDVPNITVKKTSTEKSNISILTSTTTEDGLLNTTIVTANPAGIKAALIEVIGASENQTKTALQQTSTAPDKVEEASKEDISNTVVTKAQAIVKKANRTLGNPLGSNNTFGSLGKSFGNVLGSVLGKIVGAEIPNKFGEITKGTPPGFIVPEGFDTPVNIVEADGSTNISKSTEPSQRISKAAKSSRDPYVLASNVSGWKGVATPLITTGGDYEFQIVHTSEELEAELRNTTRDITTAVTHWTRTHSDSPLNAYHIHRLHTAAQWESLGGDEDALKLLIDQGPKNGIEWHYCILKDGTIQRGRPIDIVSADGVGFAKNTIHVGFVAGYTAAFGTPNSELTLGPASITSEQWKSFDKFLEAFYKAYPGGEALSHKEIDKESTCPGFDVTVYASGKFNKATLYDDPSERSQAYTPEEQINQLPKTIKKSSVSTIDLAPNPEDLSTADVDTTPTEAELQADVARYDKLEREVKSKKRDLVTIESEIERLSTDSINDEQVNRLNQDLERKRPLYLTQRSELKTTRQRLINNGYLYSSTTGWYKNGT